MSEMDSTGQFAGAGHAGGPTAGALLRQAREACGLHIAALAVSLKVPVKKLEALETDRYDLLPDAVFVRALASSVCRTLKTDPAPVLALLPANAAPRLARDANSINEPFRAPSDGPGPSVWDQISRPAALAVLALLLGALVLVFLPDIRGQMMASREPAAGPATPPAPAMPAAESAAPGASAESSAVPMAQGTTMAPAIDTPAPADAAGATATLAMPGAMSPPVSPGASPSNPAVASPTVAVTPPAAAGPVAAPASVPGAVAAASMPASPGGIVVFTARVASWVEVTDARGTVALRRLLSPGEAAGASGALPLSVVVGRADSTEVQVRGKALDLAPHSRDNVARFEVR